MAVSRAWILATVLTCGAACAQDASVGVERTLVLRGLQERPIILGEITQSELVGRDPRTDESVRVGLDMVLAVLPALIGDARVARAQAEPERSSKQKEVGVVQLVDGQRIVGRLGASSAWESGEKLPWHNQLLGAQSLELETMRWVDFTSSLRDASPHEERVRDRVVLRNGDSGEGFVEVLADAGAGELGIRVESGGRERRMAMSRVARIELSNPPVRARGPRVWLEDGTVLEVESLRLALSGNGELAWRGVKHSFAGSSISAFAPACERVVGLATCRLTRVAPGPGRRWTRPPVVLGDAQGSALGAQDILLSGPMSATWEIEGASLRVGGRVELPAGDQVWGDCVVVIEDVSESGVAGELWRTRLHSAEPSKSFVVALPRRTEAPQTRLLRVRVEEGERGPVQDRVVLRRALVEKQ